MLNAKPALNHQKYDEPKAHVFNPTLEHVRIQAVSRGFTFKSLELTEIPLALAEVIGERVSYKGLFVVWPNQSLSDLDAIKTQALKNFKEFNDDRLQMEQAYLDERKKAGVTIDMSTQFNFNKWSKWSTELSKLLNEKKAIEPVGSFLADLEQEEDLERAPEGVVKKRGRPARAQEAQA